MAKRSETKMMTTAAHQWFAITAALTAVPALFASLGQKKAAIPVFVCCIAAFVGGASAETSPAPATTADDILVGEGACSLWDVDCDGDTIDEVLLWVALWLWTAFKVISCLRGLWAAGVWLTGTAFFVAARRIASSFFLRGGVGAAASGAARMPRLLSGLGGGGGGVAAPPVRVLEEEEEQDVELAVISPPQWQAAVGQHPPPLPA